MHWNVNSGISGLWDYKSIFSSLEVFLYFSNLLKLKYVHNEGEFYFLNHPSSRSSGNRKVHLTFFFSFHCTRLCHAGWTSFGAERGVQHLFPNLAGCCDPCVCSSSWEWNCNPSLIPKKWDQHCLQGLFSRCHPLLCRLGNKVKFIMSWGKKQVALYKSSEGVWQQI